MLLWKVKGKVENSSACKRKKGTISMFQGSVDFEFGDLITVGSVPFGLDIQMHLVNPLSGSKSSLPPQSTLKYQPTVVSNCFPWEITCVKKAKAVCRQLLVAALCGELNYLTVARPGDETWTEVESEYLCSPSLIQDVACCNGQVFALGWCGTLLLCPSIYGWSFNGCASYGWRQLTMGMDRFGYLRW